jgi:hypothetical protein
MYVAGIFFHNFFKAEKLDRKYGFGPIIARLKWAWERDSKPHLGVLNNVV